MTPCGLKIPSIFVFYFYEYASVSQRRLRCLFGVSNAHALPLLFHILFAKKSHKRVTISLYSHYAQEKFTRIGHRRTEREWTAGAAGGARVARRRCRTALRRVTLASMAPCTNRTVSTQAAVSTSRRSSRTILAVSLFTCHHGCCVALRVNCKDQAQNGWSRGTINWTKVEECQFRVSNRQFVGEPVLHRLVASMLEEPGLLPAGSVVDAGANDGEESALYADRMNATAQRLGIPVRRIHAIEPLPQNMDLLRQLSKRRPDIQPLQGALGASTGVGTLSDSLMQRKPGRGAQLHGLSQAKEAGLRGKAMIHFPIYTLDQLVSHWHGERIAFMHLDLEGDEESALQGARYTLRHQRPWFTIEVNQYMLRRANTSAENLMRTVASVGYHLYEVDEICGVQFDCRNVLCIPRADVVRFHQSATYRKLRARLFMLNMNRGRATGPACSRKSCK